MIINAEANEKIYLESSIDLLFIPLNRMFTPLDRFEYLV